MSDQETLASEFDTLRGRVLGLIESWGMPEKQESGAKQTFKSLTYDAQKSISQLLDDAS
jgi:hypothetical protein